MLLLLVSASIGIASVSIEDWQYYRTIEIKENSGTILIDYQVLVTLNSNNFPDKARLDGSDIRVTDISGNELKYWIEEFKLDAKSGLFTPQMYYGNPSATAKLY